MLSGNGMTLNSVVAKPHQITPEPRTGDGGPGEEVPPAGGSKIGKAKPLRFRLVG